ncbi:hypothetical protein ONE63_000190 [Megalurothrips usitatus]|uniref:ATP synthase subunit d, mitochondrial n=1 Tax=Megalurothrips usitatus TaxID=439358 RepID=A0AAV7Y1Q4_9NEOP|nr:hypothetical protein ONE63_000190 [Megalurothrips usitatus]
MAAQRFAGSKVNWKSILDRFPSTAEDQVTKLMKLKKNHETYLRSLAALPEKPPAIDWATYKTKLSNPAFVDAIKQKYEALQIPYPKSNVDSDINNQEQELVSENQKKVQSISEKIKELEDMMPIEQMTLQEFKQAYPEIVSCRSFKRPSTTHPTPWPCDDPETNSEWRKYLAAKEKGIPAERPRG